MLSKQLLESGLELISEVIDEDVETVPERGPRCGVGRWCKLSAFLRCYISFAV